METGIELYKSLNIGSLDELLPISAVLTKRDCVEYKAIGYQVCSIEKFYEEFPEVTHEEISHLYYTKSILNGLIYYDLENYHLFSLETYVFSDDTFSFMKTDEFNLHDRIKHRISKKDKFIENDEPYGFYRDTPPAYTLEFLTKTIQCFSEGIRYETFTHFYVQRDAGSKYLSLDFLRFMMECKSTEQKIKTIEELDEISDTDILHVYRGAVNADGYSYSLNESIARFFALRTADIHTQSVSIISGDIAKKDIIEVNNSGEQEIILFPENLSNKQVKTMWGLSFIGEDINQEYLNQKEMLYNYLDTLEIKIGEGQHDISHLLRVLYLCIIISKYYNLDSEIKQSLFCAAMLHDIGRDNDGEDDKHGLASYNMVKGILKNNTLVKSLMIYHCKPDENIFETDQEYLAYKILKDADALDRLRFGFYELDTNYLRLNYSSELLLVAYQLTNTEM